MKLATLKDGSRDGQLVVVSRDLASAHHANGIAGRLQQVLDDWNYLSPQLEDLYQTLNHGKARHAFAFEPAQCMAPLPRAFGLALAAEAAGVPTPAIGDGMLGPCDDVVLVDDAKGLDFHPALLAATGDLPIAATPDQALEGIRLLMLGCAWQLAAPAGTAAQWPAPSFAPVAITPDELGPAWHGGRVALGIVAAINGQRSAAIDGARAMPRHLGECIAALAGTRRLRAGALVGAWLRTGIETGPATAALRHGDHLRLEAIGDGGLSPFGAIAQVVAPLPD